MTKNIKFVITRIVFFKLKMHQNPFSAGAPTRTPLGELYDAPPGPLVDWGGDTLSPYHSPLDAFISVSNSAPTAPRFSGPAPQHKILATPVPACQLALLQCTLWAKFQ